MINLYRLCAIIQTRCWPACQHAAPQPGSFLTVRARDRADAGGRLAVERAARMLYSTGRVTTVCGASTAGTQRPAGRTATGYYRPDRSTRVARAGSAALDVRPFDTFGRAQPGILSIRPAHVPVTTQQFHSYGGEAFAWGAAAPGDGFARCGARCR